MDESPLLPVSQPRTRPAALLVGGVGVLALGLYAVGPGRLYQGDTGPDYLAMLAASILVLTGFVEGAARDRAGAWSWRRLRGPSFVACGLALVLLVVVSAMLPDEAGAWPVGESAQGFLVFTFVGTLAVAIAAAAKASGGAGVTQLTGDPAVGGLHSAGAARIALRRYRLLSREAYVDVDAAGVTVVVPRVFGGGRSWFIPIEMVGVVLPDQEGIDGGPDPAGDDEWVTEQEFRVPFLSMTSPLAGPNLTMLFTVPQRIPPIPWFAARDLGISSSATRKEPGVMVDGVQLRVVDPEAATQALLAHGAQGIADPGEFVQQHRDVVRDPDQVRAAVADERRLTFVTVVSGVAAVALFIAVMVTDDDRYGVALVAVLVVSWVLEWVLRRRRRA